MKTKIKRTWNLITTILVAVVVLFAAALVGGKLLGLQVYTVLSGSMEPEYHTGSVIYVKKVDTDTLKPNDVITFMLSETTVATHRIVEVIPDDEDPTITRFSTKGDANDVVDASLVHEANVLGKPVFSIPYLGYVISYIQNPPGTYIAISVGAFLMLLLFLPDLLFDEDEEEEKNK